MASGRTYLETFDNGPGGWLGWESNAAGARTLEVAGGVAVSRGPWWVDYNHAPPGGGYLHLLYALHTRHYPETPAQYLRVGGRNQFVDGAFPTDFTGARFTVRIRGSLAARGAGLHLLVQSRVDGKAVNYVLTGQRLEVTEDWSDQTLVLSPDESQWTCLGSRHDRTSTYGDAGIGRVLGDVNLDIILILFPLQIAPADPGITDPHGLRAGEDYALDVSRLPDGVIMLDTVRIDFAS
jgi:hypothetical protein